MRSLRLLGVATAASALLSSTVAAQATVPSPLQLDGTEPTFGLPLVRPDLGTVADLQWHQLVRMSGFIASDGSLLELDLERIDLNRPGFRFYVDGAPAPGLLEGLDLSLWQGRVAGDPSSEAMLSFSREGCRGWVRFHGDVTHVMPQPGPGNNWEESYALLVAESQLQAYGVGLGDFCSDPAPVTFDATPEETPSAVPLGGTADGGCTLRDCPIAVETDYQLFQQFGSLGAETAYVTTLLGAASARYEEQIETVLTYPYVMFHTSSNDGWSSPESGGSQGSVLSELVAAWQGNIPNGAVLGHFLSGANLGGGVAYLDVLCNTAATHAFGVSGNINGGLSFPIQQQPNNWDFIVFTHELGHNFGSPHTHDYCPPVDECAPAGYEGSCQNGQTCTSSGTIMSYCHQCSGGTANITTFFHPTVVNVMKGGATSCLPLYVSLEPDPIPQLVAPGVPTVLTVQMTGTPANGVDMHWRLRPTDPFTTTPMASQGGGSWAGNLPAASCGDAPEVWFSTTDVVCGYAQTGVESIDVGLETTLYFADFETSAAGWTVGAPGDDATTGIWTLGDPNGTGAQPSTGYGPSADCWFTGQGSPGGSLGEADIDGGVTTLTSPLIDLSAGDARVSYRRWYSNDAGAGANQDVFVVQVSNNGGANWTTAETVGPAGPGTSGGWLLGSFDVSDFVAPSASVRVRFRAADEGEGSLVEAALDDFTVARLDCGVCQPDLGFAGPGSSTLSLCGQALASGNTAQLVVANAPAFAPAFVAISGQSNPTSLFGGTVITLPLELLLPLSTDATGTASYTVPGGASQPLSAYLQAAIYDPSLPHLFQITNALRADFLP